MAFVKCRFYSRDHGATAGLIFAVDKAGRLRSPRGEVLSLEDVSRCFPNYEAPKMVNYEVSQKYDTWEEAFAHQFPNRG